MKRLIYILVILPLLGFGQVKIKVLAVEIADNVSDKTVDYGTTIGFNAREPRLLIKAQIVNNTDTPINLWNGIGGAYLLYYSYKSNDNLESQVGFASYKSRQYGEKCDFFNDYLTQKTIKCGEKYDILLYCLLRNFPKNDYTKAFFELMASFKLVYISDKEQRGMPSKIEAQITDWTQITVKPDSPITNSERFDPSTNNIKSTIRLPTLIEVAPYQR